MVMRDCVNRWGDAFAKDWIRPMQFVMDALSPVSSRCSSSENRQPTMSLNMLFIYTRFLSSKLSTIFVHKQVSQLCEAVK